MFKYLLVVLVVWCETRQYAVAEETTQVLPVLNNDNGNWTVNTEELSKKPVIAINGNNNYNVGQQIFYIYDEDQLKRVLINNNISQKMDTGSTGNTGLTTHKLIARKVTWNYARQSCNENGGYLAVINTEEEEKLLLQIMIDNNIKSAWVGVHDIYQEGEWITIQGDPIEKTAFKWSTKFKGIQPDNFGGHQNCGLLIAPDGGMDDENCSFANSFFCETAA